MRRSPATWCCSWCHAGTLGWQALAVADDQPCSVAADIRCLQDEGTPQDDNSKQGDQSELPPGYGSFLDAHVRT